MWFDRRFNRLWLGALVWGALMSPLAAQKFEIHPYAGGFFSRGSDLNSGRIDFKDEGLYGVKGGVFLTDRFEVEGNFGYLNHFEFQSTDPKSRGILWEAAGSYHFPVGMFRPYITAGAGGLTAVVAGDSPKVPFDDGDTFFTFSYGGGVKAERLWGPVGLRADVRGRTLPNVRSTDLSWLELTGGILLSWGEK